MRKMRDQPLVYYITVAIGLGLSIFIGKIIFISHPVADNQKGTNVLVASKNNVKVLSAEQQQEKNLVVSKMAFEKALKVEEKITDAAHSIGGAPGDVCTTAEFAGTGPASSQVSTKNWVKIMVQYHGLKGKILGWLEEDHAKYPKKYTAESFAWMQSQIKELRVQRPVSSDEPDLSWRGIGAVSYDSGGVILRIGGSFPALMTLNPPRARFELARLIAQAWSPCEFEKAKQTSPWADALKCLGVDSAAKCDSSLSEAGWAVSSAVAKTVANPGCRVPAFTDDSVACLDSGEHK